MQGTGGRSGRSTPLRTPGVARGGPLRRAKRSTYPRRHFEQCRLPKLQQGAQVQNARTGRCATAQKPHSIGKNHNRRRNLSQAEGMRPAPRKSHPSQPPIDHCQHKNRQRPGSCGLLKPGVVNDQKKDQPPERMRQGQNPKDPRQLPAEREVGRDPAESKEQHQPHHQDRKPHTALGRNRGDFRTPRGSGKTPETSHGQQRDEAHLSQISGNVAAREPV